MSALISFRALTRSGLTAVCAAALAAPGAQAQWEIALHGGIHADRAERADRFLATPDGGRLEAAQGEATVWGARSTYWHRPQLGFQADVSHSHNESWFGNTSVPPPDFANTTTYLSARAVARTAPARRVQLFVGAGPALMLHGGTGTSYRGRDTDVGGAIEAGARLRLAGRLNFQLAIGNYLYISRYTQASPSTEPVAQPVPPGNDFKHDVLVLPGLVWSWR